MRTNYEERLRLPLINQDPFITLYSISMVPLATGYTEIVIGQRGPYIEFRRNQIHWENFFIPQELLWKVNSPSVDYIEYRSVDPTYTKLYLQKREVDYAAYKINMCYISPFDILFYSFSLKVYQKVIEKLYPKKA